MAAMDGDVKSIKLAQNSWSMFNVPDADAKSGCGGNKERFRRTSGGRRKIKAKQGYLFKKGCGG